MKPALAPRLSWKHSPSRCGACRGSDLVGPERAVRTPHRRRRRGVRHLRRADGRVRGRHHHHADGRRLIRGPHRLEVHPRADHLPVDVLPRAGHLRDDRQVAPPCGRPSATPVTLRSAAIAVAVMSPRRATEAVPEAAGSHSRSTRSVHSRTAKPRSARSPHPLSTHATTRKAAASPDVPGSRWGCCRGRASKIQSAAGFRRACGQSDPSVARCRLGPDRPRHLRREDHRVHPVRDHRDLVLGHRESRRVRAHRRAGRPHRGRDLPVHPVHDPEGHRPAVRRRDGYRREVPLHAGHVGRRRAGHLAGRHVRPAAGGRCAWRRREGRHCLDSIPRRPRRARRQPESSKLPSVPMSKVVSCRFLQRM